MTADPSGRTPTRSPAVRSAAAQARSEGLGEPGVAIRVATEHMVRFAIADGSVETLEGPVRAQAGDAIVEGVDGEHWPVRPERFRKLYAPARGTQDGRDGVYRRRSGRATVRPVLADRIEVVLPDGGGVLHGGAGDFVVDDDAGRRIVSRRPFAHGWVWNATAASHAVQSYEAFEHDLADAHRHRPLMRAVESAVGGTFALLVAMLQSRLLQRLSLPGAWLLDFAAGVRAAHPGLHDGPAHEPDASRTGAHAADGHAAEAHEPDAHEPDAHGSAQRRWHPPLAERADAIANRYARLQRGGIVAIHALGAAAVSLAVIPIALPMPTGAAITLGVVELAALLVLLLLYRTTLGWRRRWIETRSLAEGFRAAELGQLPDPVPGAPWWQPVLVANSAPAQRRGELRRCDQATLRTVARDQLRYHAGNARHCGALAHAGERLAATLFLASLLGCALHLWLHWPGLLLATAALPAWSAAVHGVLGGLELDHLAASSERSAEAIAALLQRIGPAADAQPDAPAADADIAELASILASEHGLWRSARARRGPPLA